MHTPRHLRALAHAALALLACAAIVPPAAAQAGTTRYIVAYKPGSAGAARAAVAAARGDVKLAIHGTDAIAAELPAQAVAALARNPAVEYVEEDVKRYPMGGTSPTTGTPYAVGQLLPYGIAMVQADQLAGVSVASRKVCIIDSGYDRSHEDLSAGGNVTGEYDPGTGWWYTDENHHGTHVAGTVSALDNAGGVVGVNSNGTIKLHIVKVFGAEAWAYSSTLAAAANRCRDAGANIISMSLGGSFSSRTEQRTFDTLLSTNNILSIAAAGNGGNTRVSYPAGYGSVVSVAAIDEARQWATFSQYNKDVEIAGPGVNVLSTVPMGTGRASALSVGAAAYAPGGMDGSPIASVGAPLADFGLGGSAVAGSMNGKVCLIQRGTYDFATKVSNCQVSGGVGAVIYNNVAGSFGGTLGGTVTAIPSVTASDTEGAAMRGQFGQTATVSVTASNYAFFDGTSMATPHVSAVAALVWAMRPECTASQLRSSLNLSALDLGPAGRDNKFGYGLVQAKAAVDRIAARGCGR
ncbi:S8 family serine peptidase [uncultured Piscinibacter sp.]|uniref:S8 family serine peptidase n=1 Tax=uncultured Piscinibacter sp. TaxID=1131835 RepID=UPI00261BB15B|nr:S8 family serine peptidase [uncultured Piscinibacter sp.]